MPTLNEQVIAIVANLNRDGGNLDIFMNGDENATYTDTGATVVPAVQKMVKDFEDRTEYTGEYVGGGTAYTRGQTFNEVWVAYVVTSDFTSTTFGGDAANYKVSFDLTDIVQDAEDAATAAAASAVAAGDSETAAAASAAAAAQSVIDAAAEVALAALEKTYSEEWATKPEDTLVSVSAGGDGVTDYSSLHWAKKSEAARDEAVAATPEELFETIDKASSVRRHPLRNGVYSDGSTFALSVPQQTGTDAGTDDFTVFLPTFALSSYTPASAITLWTNESGNTGVRIILETTGALTIEFGDGVDWDASFTTTALLDTIPDYSPVTVYASADRDGSCQFFVDGIAFDSVVISTASAIDVDTASAWEVLPSDEGWLYGQYARSTSLMTIGTALEYFGLPDLLVNGAGDLNHFSSDWSVDADGWDNIDSDVVTGGETIDGDVDWLKDLKSTNTDVSGVTIPGGADSMVVGRTYRITGEFFTPTGSVIDGYRIRFIAGGSTSAADTVTANTRKTFRHDFTHTSAPSGLQIQPQSGGSRNFVGDGVDDALFIRNFNITELGTVETIDLSVSGTSKTDLVGVNNATSGANTVDSI
tara:strand:- start:23878 stop:25641 length:1764 start_codon:yes stop_codon:yes gene_type:complete